MILRLKEELGLSDGQVEQLEAIKADVQGQMKSHKDAVKARRDALQEAVKSGAEESAIRAAATEFGKAIGGRAVLRVNTKVKVDGVLTDAQKSELKQLKGQRGQGKRGTGKGTGGRAALGRRAGDPKATFARIDSDGDGVISLEEFKAHREQMRKRIGGEGLRNRLGRRHGWPIEESKD